MFLQSVSVVFLDDRGFPAWQGALERLKIMGFFHEVQISQTCKDVVNWIYLCVRLLRWPVCDLWEEGQSGSKYCLPLLTFQ